MDNKQSTLINCRAFYISAVEISNEERQHGILDGRGGEFCSFERCCSVTQLCQSFPASGSFPVSQFFTSGGQSIGASASASVLSMNIQD